MNYTIATMEEMATHNVVRLIKDGNRYYIEFSAESKQTVRKHFDSIVDAADVFHKFVDAFVTGCCNYNIRKGWLD